MTGIYKIDNPAGAVYIGQSREVYKRWKHLKAMACPRPILLVNSIRDNGADAHSFSIINELPEDVSQLVLDTYEQLYISQFKECGFNMLNIQGGGRGAKHSQSTVQKLRLKIVSTESKKKISVAHAGKILSDAHKEKLRIAHTGKKQTELHIERAAMGHFRPIEQYSKLGVLIKIWPSTKSAATSLNIRNGCISSCLHKKTKTAGGFVWKFINN